MCIRDRGHFSEHLGAEELLLLSNGVAGEYAAEEICGLGGGKVSGLRGGMAVVGGLAAERVEAGAGNAEGLSLIHI